MVVCNLPTTTVSFVQESEFSFIENCIIGLKLNDLNTTCLGNSSTII